MKKAILLVGLLVLAMGSASAQDFSTEATDFAALMLNNTIAQMQQAQAILKIMSAAEGAGALDYQNIWGVAYGGLVLASINNQVTGLTLDAILNTNYTYGGYPLYVVVGRAVNMLGQNATEVFGDPQGTEGLSKLLMAQVEVLKDPTLYDYDFLKAYSTELAKTMYAGILFFIELAKEIPEAFT